MDNKSDSESATFRFAGFISYSQKDKKWAKRIHRALEAYRLPTGLAPDVSPDLTKTKRLGRFFRDDDELAGAPSLSDALESSLNSSAALIVVCSPNSARSKWVDAEIRRFKSRGPSARVLAVIVDGKPDSPDPEVMCFPPSMLRKVDENGELTDEPDEPLAPDANKEPFNRLIVRLVAGLLGLEFDSLWQREQRRKRKQRILMTSAAVVAAIGIGTGTMMYLEAERERKLAEIEQLRTESVNLATAAQQAMDEGRVDDALVAALDALPQELATPERPITPQAVAALKRVMSANHAAGIITRFEQSVNEMHLLPDGRLAVWLEDGQVHVVNAQSGTSDWQSPEGQRLNWLGNKGLVASIDSDESLDSEGKIQVQHEVSVYDLETGTILRKLMSDDLTWWVGPHAPLSPSAKHLLVKRSVPAPDEEKNDLAVWSVPTTGEASTPVMVAKIDAPTLDVREHLDSTFIDDNTVVLSWGPPRRTLALWRLGEAKLHILSAPDSPLACDGQQLNASDKRRDKVSLSADRKFITLARPANDAQWCAELWNASTGKAVSSLLVDERHIGTIDALSSDAVVVAHSGRSFSSGSVWDRYGKDLRLADCKAQRSGLNPFVIDESEWLIDSSAAFSACADGASIHTYLGSTYADQRSLHGHKGKVRALAFHPDSSILYSAADDGQLRTWDFSNTPRNLPADGHTLSMASAPGVMASAYRAVDGNFYARAYTTSGAALTPPMPFSIEGPTSDEPSDLRLDRDLMFVNDGKSLALFESSDCGYKCGPDEPRLLTLYRVADGAQLAQFDKLQRGYFLATIPIEYAQTVKGERLALPRGDGSVVEVDSATGKIIHTHVIDGWHASDVVYLQDTLWILASDKEEDPYQRKMGLFKIDGKDVATPLLTQRAQGGRLFSSPSTRTALVEMDIINREQSPAPSRFALLESGKEILTIDLPTTHKERSERLHAAYFYDNESRLALLFSDESVAPLDIDVVSGNSTPIGASLPASMLDPWRVEDPLSRVTASIDNDQLFLLPLPGQEAVCPDLSARSADAAAFSPDGSLLVLAEYSDSKLTVYEMGSCSVVYSAPFGVRHNGQLAFADDSTLWTINGYDHVRIVHLVNDLAKTHQQAKKLRKTLGLAKRVEAKDIKQ